MTDRFRTREKRKKLLRKKKKDLILNTSEKCFCALPVSLCLLSTVPLLPAPLSLPSTTRSVSVFLSQ